MVSKTHYSFQSVWNIDAPPEAVWQTLTATPFSWSDWWPQLRDVHGMKVKPGLTGSSFSCTWRAPIGYGLKSDIVIGKVIKLKRVQLYADGDLVGTVTCAIHEVGSGTRIDIDWQVETTKPWMNRLAFLLRPFFIWSHHSVMRSGERGLAQYINVTKKSGDKVGFFSC